MLEFQALKKSSVKTLIPNPRVLGEQDVFSLITK